MENKRWAGDEIEIVRSIPCQIVHLHKRIHVPSDQKGGVRTYHTAPWVLNANVGPLDQSCLATEHPPR